MDLFQPWKIQLFGEICIAQRIEQYKMVKLKFYLMIIVPDIPKLLPLNPDEIRRGMCLFGHIPKINAIYDNFFQFKKERRKDRVDHNNGWIKKDNKLKSCCKNFL